MPRNDVPGQKVKSLASTIHMRVLYGSSSADQFGSFRVRQWVAIFLSEVVVTRNDRGKLASLVINVESFSNSYR